MQGFKCILLQEKFVPKGSVDNKSSLVQVIDVRLEGDRLLPEPAIAHFTDTLGLNTLRPRQNGRYFPDDIFKLIFLNEDV